ncbi:MAG TPA: type II secretion system secretin GspD [Steroidobacteraceae bacterium]|nr:type II secretion system secretin GspD [Steroidobacteraceae bacterium]
MKRKLLDRVALAAACTALAGLLSIASPGVSLGQAQGAITPNYKDADLSQIIEAVSAVTGKNFIVDPRVKAQVTMLSSTPMSPDAFYQAFLSILQVHGFVAVPAGKVIKILPDANARQLPANDLPGTVSATSDEIVTQVIAVKNVSAAQLVPILRPLIPQYGHLAAYPASNMLIISDRASNVNRMQRIIERIDQTGDAQVDVIPLEHASAAEVVRVVNSLYTTAAAEGGGLPNVKMVADERTNSVLVSGDASQRLRLKTLVAHLDTPLQTGGDTQVRYLRYADAEKIAAKLREQIQGITATVAAAGGGGPGAGTPVTVTTGGGDKSVTIWAEPQTNALVVSAPPKIMRSIMSIVDRLDIRRAQVLLEGILVEMTVDKSIDLGVNWAVLHRDSEGNVDVPVGGFLQPINGTGLGEILQGIRDPKSITQLPSGLTLGVGQLVDTGLSWAAIIRALQATGNTNIIATPSVVTLDNEEAEIKVAKEVPIVTGSYTNQGIGNATGQVNPFQTINREEVGVILKITPQINDNGSVVLKISQEVSNVAASAEQVLAAQQGLITNKRQITTNVLAEDGGVIVLGGLLSDEAREEKSQVPFLGSIPLLGELFKTRSVNKVKTNLMFFIRPRILRDSVDAAIETNAKYNYIRKQQTEAFGTTVPLMPQTPQPALPPLEELVPTDQLREAEKLAPQGTTPAQRATVESTSPSIEQPGPAAAEPGTVAPTPPGRAAPPPTTAPFGTPPPEPPPATTPPGTTP